MTLQGSWIWYELMTPDADRSKAFYDNVVGWSSDGVSYVAASDLNAAELHEFATRWQAETRS